MLKILITDEDEDITETSNMIYREVFRYL